MECAGDSLTEACGSQADGPGGCYWVLDVLAWRGLDLAGCNAEFRLYWLAAKLREDDVLGAAIGPGHRFRWARHREDCIVRNYSLCVKGIYMSGRGGLPAMVC